MQTQFNCMFIVLSFPIALCRQYHSQIIIEIIKFFVDSLSTIFVDKLIFNTLSDANTDNMTSRHLSWRLVTSDN